jgi:hypothetical protein
MSPLWRAAEESIMYSPYFAMCLSSECIGLAIAVLYAQGRIPEAIFLFLAWA